MIHHSKSFSRIMKWPLKLFVRTRSIYSDEVKALAQQQGCNLLYVLEDDSAIDTMTLADETEQMGLPSPYLQGEYPSILYVNRKRFGRGHQAKLDQAFASLIKAHKANPKLDIQIIPVKHFWGRAPGKSSSGILSWLADRPAPGWLRRTWVMLFLGRDHFIRFASPVSLRDFVERYGDDPANAHRITRIARTHFYRQRIASTGPRLPNMQRMFKELSKNEAIRQITDADPAKQAELQKQAKSYMKEIAATYSYGMLLAVDRLMTWLWNRIYSGISVNNVEQIRQLAETGKEIVYVPCHRSHMDYLLLSYVIYQQGLVPPHIAAGINLNFWPAGPLFRRGGAFFIRRSFRGNKLYSTVFREYLSWLFKEGFPVEYFTEGGRSRTGRLLSPKTGMISMTVQSQLSSQGRPIVLVPIYLGYEHVMEVTTYLKELKGKNKDKESFWNSLSIIRKLRNYGQGFVNFGTPIPLDDYLSQHEPNWRNSQEDRPAWLSGAVNGLAQTIMTEINNAAAINGLTLTALSLLSSEHYAMSERSLARFMDLCLNLARDASYHPNTTIPLKNGDELLQQTLALDKFTVSKGTLGNVVSLDGYNQIIMTYYRNNIIHLYVLPSLIAALVDTHGSLEREGLEAVVRQLYPLLKAELFMGPDDEGLSHYIEQILISLQKQQLLTIDGNEVQAAESRSDQRLQLNHLGNIMAETLQRYCIVLELLSEKSELSRGALEGSSRAVAEQLGSLHGISAPEFFDKQLFASLCIQLKNMGLLEQDEEAKIRLKDSLQEVSALVSSEIHQSIRQLVKEA